MGALRVSQRIHAEIRDRADGDSKPSPDGRSGSDTFDLSLTEAVHRIVIQSGERPAIETAARAVTYAQLWESATVTAHSLQRIGVGQGDVIAICVSPGVDHVTAMLAALMTRAAYVSVDQRIPRLRVRHMLDDVRAAAVVGPGLEITRLRSSACPGTESSRGRGRSDGDEGQVVEDTVCVFYTSGTTGRPKGVPQTHRGITRLFDTGGPLRFPEPTRMAHGTHVMFDGVVLEIWPTLAQGGTIVRVETSELLGFRSLPSLIARRGIDAMFVPTGVLREMVAANPVAGARLKTLYTGGEALDARTASAVLEQSQDSQFFNLYGPAEGTVVTTAAKLKQAMLGEGVVPIGRVIPRTTVRVLGDDLVPVPTGAVGELFVGGDGVSPGYLNRPDLTERSFVRLPERDMEASTTWYRTGDLVRVLGDGQLAYCGRRDRQVKLAGFRVELEEIEATIAGHPDVHACAVDVVHSKKNPTGGWLVAFVSASDALGEIAMRRWLGDRLPYFQIPREIHFMERMPLTDSGKTDRASLRRPVEAGREGTSVSDPRARVAAIWESVLGFAVPDIDRNFFEAGGNSIDLISLQDAYATQAGSTPSLAELMRHTTISQQAAALLPVHLERRES